DDRVILGIGTAARNKIKVIAPTVVKESRHFVLIKPAKAEDRPFKIFRLLRCSIQRQVSPRHVAAAFRGVLRSHPQEGPKVDRALPNDLLQDSLGKLVAKHPWASPG